MAVPDERNWGDYFESIMDLLREMNVGVLWGTEQPDQGHDEEDWLIIRRGILLWFDWWQALKA